MNASNPPPLAPGVCSECRGNGHVFGLTCEPCGGSGNRPPVDGEACLACNGNGFTVSDSNLPAICGECGGSGYMVSRKPMARLMARVTERQKGAA